MTSVDPIQIRSRKIGLSWTIVQFYDDADHYGFSDQLYSGETRQDGMARIAGETYSMLVQGDYDPIVEDLESYEDEDLEPDTEAIRRSILRELKELKKLDARTITKNIFGNRRRA